ncbi:hypothetical protein [Tabrizicola sp.]|uniref:hypothetical protein n=1 Tax=Tabrizicola sp. TaxID=2005166 RepID=UPI001A45FA13|nr:hypothetical protein [Tabrizicola sp.]MBL9075140.1 hypothetical protein [Tabrizicola sp.]
MTAAVVIVVIIIVVVVIIIIVVIVVIVVIVMTATRMIVDDLNLAVAPRGRCPEVAQDFARPRVEDDLALAIGSAGHDAHPTQKGPLLHNRTEALLSQLSDNAFDVFLRGNGRSQRKGDRKTR